LLSNLRTAIRVRGLKQIDLALTLRIDPTFLSQVINGRREANATVRFRIAEFLRADESWLFSTVTRIPAPPPSQADEGLTHAIV